MAKLKIVSDGDPHPALAGDNLVDETTERQFTGAFGISDQSHNFNITYRAGTDSDQPEAINPSLPIGITTNGVVIYSSASSDSSLPSSTSIAPNGYNWDMGFDGFSTNFPLDPCGGKADDASGEYRYRTGNFHTKGMASNGFVESSTYYSATGAFGNSDLDRLRHGTLTHNGTDYTTGHSRIVGWAFDGYPIYGPYGFSDPLDPTSSVVRMRSSYRLRAQNEMLPGRPQFFQVSNGSFVQDYVFDLTTGTLDSHNGRFCITPDYKQGTYAYFLTFSDSGIVDPEYPYIIGPSTRQQRVLL